MSRFNISNLPCHGTSSMTLPERFWKRFAPSMLIGMLRTKAVEAASVFAEANTRKLKPTQRSHRCGAIVKKELKERGHVCACGTDCGRDENAAKTILRWMLKGDFWLGTQPEGGRSLPSETPSIAATAAWVG